MTLPGPAKPGILAALASLLLLAACSSPAPAPAAPPEPMAEPSASSAAPLRPATVGAPFELGTWRITVTSIKCGTAAELLAQNADNGQEPTDRVCVAALSYTNTDKVPHVFGGTLDQHAPEAVYAGIAGDGSRYDGHGWLQDTTNPGLTQTSVLIFKVAAGVSLAVLEIGDVRVSTV